MQVLKSFVDRLKLLSDLDVAMVDMLQELDNRLSSLEKSHDKTKKLTDANCARIGEIHLLLGAKRDNLS